MNDSRIKEKDAARAVSAALNKEAVSKIDKSLSALAKKLDSKIIQAMGFVGLAGSVGSFAHPSFLDLPSASPELIIASAFISATVLAVSNYAEYYSSPARENVYLPGKQHTLQSYFNSFDKSDFIRNAYLSSQKGNGLYEKGHELADSMALKFFKLRKMTHSDFARFFVKSYPASADTTTDEMKRLKTMNRKRDTYSFYHLTDPNVLEQQIDNKLSRQAHLPNDAPSDFDYYLVQLFASVGNDNAISRVIQDSPLAQWLQPLFDNNKQILTALQANTVGNKEKMLQFVSDMHFALGDLSALVLGKDLSNYQQIKEYEKLTLKSLGGALQTVQTSILQQSLCEDISELLTDVYDHSQPVPIEQFSALVTRLLTVVEKQRFSARNEQNPSPSVDDAKLSDLTQIAGILGHLLEDMCLHDKNELTLADIQLVPELDTYFSTMVRNSTTSNIRHSRVESIAQTLHQKSFGKPMKDFNEKELHSQWFENIIKEIHEKAIMGISRLDSPNLQVKYLDELLEEYPARLSGLHHSRTDVGKISRFLASPFVSAKDILDSGYERVTRKHANVRDPAEINSSFDLSAAKVKLQQSMNVATPPSSSNPAPQSTNPSIRP